MTRSERDSERHFPRWLLIVVKGSASIFLGVAFVALLLDRFSSGVVSIQISGRSALVAFVGLLIIRLALSRFTRQRLGSRMAGGRDTSASEETDSVDPGGAAGAFVRAHGDGTDGLIALLVKILADPEMHFSRIRESVEIHGSHYEHTAELLFEAPLSSEQYWLLPIMLQRKRALVDSLRIECESKTLAPLPFMQNQGATVLAARALVQMTRNEGGAVSKALENRICSVLTATSESGNKMLMLELATAMGGVHGAATTQKALESLIVSGSDSYLIYALVPATQSGATVITVRSSFRRPENQASIATFVQLLVGLRRRDHVFFLDRASQAASYHMNITVPRGMYIHESIFSLLDYSGSKPRPVKSPKLPTRSTGTKTLHVYFRNFVNADRSLLPVVRLNLRESPPGLMEFSFFVSAGLALLVWLVSLKYSTVFPSKTGSGAWSTVLFGVPTLLSGWIASRIDKATLSRVSLLTLASCALLFVNSTLAVTAAAFKSVGTEITDGPWDIGLLHFIHPIWGLLVLSCTLNFFICGAASVARSLRFTLISLGLTKNTFSEHYERNSF